MKAFFRTLGRLIFNRWTLGIIGLIALSLLIWFIGPLVAIAEAEPFAGEVTRLVVIFILFLLWAVWNMLYLAKSKKTNAKVVEDIIDDGDSEQEIADTALDSEASQIRDRMQDALSTLKTMKLKGKLKLYQLPWYIIIGPPGSGKTTALVNSGLNFPLAERLGKNAVHGIGGTRNCDWWFTDEAVLIDTAGRFTTQDSHAEADSKGWANFLEILKKHRPRRPINGAVIAVSITDLLTQTEAERNIQARAIRKRLAELNQQLGMSFPVYVMFTKADLIAGFLEFFDDLSREERSQIWGFTFSSAENKKENNDCIAQFNNKFLELLQRANERLLTRLQQERDPARRAQVYEFPKQMRALQANADNFLKEIFAPNKFEEQPLIRGVYLASGTQVGTPIDRIMNGLARSFGMDQTAVQPHMSASRSFFLTRIFQEVIFPEADVAGTNRKFDRRRRLLLSATYLVFFALLGGGLAGWVNSYRENNNLIDHVKTDIKDYSEYTAGKLDDKTDLFTLSESLTKLRQFPAGYDERDIDPSWTMELGLYQGEKLGQEAQSTYYRAINKYFVPYLKTRLEEQIVEGQDYPDYLYAALKRYLMLYLPKKMDKEEFTIWMEEDWSRTLPGQMNENLRKQLSEHLAVALQNKLRVPSMDDQLVKAARFELSKTPMAETLYRQLKQEFTQEESEKDVRLNEIMGTKANRFFSRRGGVPLYQPIPELYTYSGYHTIFRVQNALLAKRLTKERWVMGDEDGELTAEIEKDLQKKVEALYYADYIEYWKGVTRDLTITNYSNPEAGVELLTFLTGPNDPISSLLKVVKENTELSKAPEIPGMKGGSTGIMAIDAKTSRVRNRIGRITPRNVRKMKITLPGEEVDREFKALNEFTENDYNGGKELAKAISLFDDLNIYVETLISSDNFGEAAYNATRDQSSGNNIVNKIKRKSRHMPKPVKLWLEQAAGDSKALTVSGTNQQINNIWRGTVLAEFKQNIADKYPIDRNATDEITLKEFGAYFGYSGTLDRFFQTNIAPFVNTNMSPWSWKRRLGLSDRTLRFFENVQVIREAFFEKGSSQPNIGFALKPRSLDKHISQFILEISGQRISYMHGPVRTVNMMWPGEDIDGRTRVVFTPPGGGRPSSMTKDGPWALFRLLDEMVVENTTLTDTYLIDFNVQGSTATYELKINNNYNPFQLDELEQFKCPNKL